MKQLRILKEEPDLLITLPLSLFFILLILLVRVFSIKIRVGFLKNDRIGHFAANTELNILEKKYYNINSLDLYYFPRKKTCNTVLSNLWKRHLVILPRYILRPIDLIFRNFKFFKTFSCGITYNEDRDILNLLEIFPTTLSWTKDEEIYGYQELAKMGINKYDKFICLNVRDYAYLNSIYKSNSEYHNYRNCDINNYIKAIKYLNDLGYFVIRMGAKVNKKVNYQNVRFIDYAFDGYRTEFMDIFLGSNCFFCITTSSGFDAIPSIFRKPILYTNVTPVGYFMTFQKNIIITPKNHFSIPLKRYLTFNEILNSNLFLSLNSLDFENSGVQLIENTPDELTNAVIDQLEMLENIGNFNKIDFQNIFWNNYPNEIKALNGKRLHGKIFSKISNSFIKSNQHWLN